MYNGVQTNTLTTRIIPKQSDLAFERTYHKLFRTIPCNHNESWLVLVQNKQVLINKGKSRLV